MQERIRSDAGRTTMICVNSYENRVPAGFFYNFSQEDEGHPFHGLMDLILGIEQILDSSNFPQSFTAVRSFAPMQEPKLKDTVENKCRKGELATFVVKVLFRQHTSWQGSVTWLDTGSEQSFRSVLELALLMDSALSGDAE